jgi:HTH-type transcriptional regulator/antitoxin HigA
MNLRPIQSDEDYRQTLKDIESLMAAEADTPEGEQLSVLSRLVEDYEQAQFFVDSPNTEGTVSLSTSISKVRPC